ncbi:MAG TPA: SRPBCC family protein [Polyangia bacterium]|jgi:ribosome-associated toxin RatA of RatAB toxin-antitoxin module
MAPTLGAGILVAALGPFAPADSLVSVGRADGGRGCHIAVRAVIEAPLADVHAVLAEFARYSEWFPTMRSSTRTSNGDYEVSFRLPWPLKNVRGRLAVVDDLDATGATIRWRQLDGDFGRNEGSWTLRRVGNNRTSVQYDNVVQFRRWVPNWLVARVERRVAPQVIAAIQNRANDRRRAVLRSAFLGPPRAP